VATISVYTSQPLSNLPTSKLTLPGWMNTRPEGTQTIAAYKRKLSKKVTDEMPDQ